jgi:hypothetical protein
LKSNPELLILNASPLATNTSAYLRNSGLLIFLILCTNKLGFKLAGGEEQYLAMAKQFVNPNWIPNSFTLNEFAGTRIVFQWIVGFFLQFFEFEWVTFFARLLNFAWTSIPLALLFKRLNIGYAGVFIVTQLFVMSDQSFLGYEWIFRSFEPKSIAYIFLFYGLVNVLDEKYNRAALFLALSTLFHILVGGWFVLTLGLFLLFNKGWKTAFTMGGLYLLMLLPFAAYLFYGYFLNPAPVTDINLDSVYVYERLPHHLGIFKSLDYFVKDHLTGVIISVLAFGLGMWWLKKKQGKQKVLVQLMLIMLGINLFFVIVAWIDYQFMNSSGGLGLKFYPFRTNSLAMFILFILLFQSIHAFLKPQSFYVWTARIVTALVVLLGVVQWINNIKFHLKADDLAFDEMALYINENTEPETVFTILGVPYNSDLFSSFSRKAERENFFVHKFVAAEKFKLLEWKQRKTAYNQLRKDISYAEELKDPYALDYVLSQKAFTESSLQLVYQNSDYYLYKIR